MAALAFACCVAALSLATGCAAALAAEVEPHAAPVKPVCLGATETREAVKAHKLLEPFAALKSAAQQRKAEALSAKLCHTGDEFIYEITLLHRDGRLVHVQMEAGSGKLVARSPHEPRESTREQPQAREPPQPHEQPQAHEQPVKN